MSTELHDIKTNIEIGQQIFDAVPKNLQPKWAGVILNKFNKHITEIPEQIKELNDIIKKPDRWHEGLIFMRFQKFNISPLSLNSPRIILVSNSFIKIDVHILGILEASVTIF